MAYAGKSLAKREVYTDIEINGTPAQVWQVLMDWKKYPEWNPFFKTIEGEAKVGSRLTEHVFVIPQKPVKMYSKVIVVEPEVEFAWLGHFAFQKFGEGSHHFRIVPIGEGKVRFEHFEFLEGIVMDLFFDLFLGARFKHHFNQMNHAIKERVESQSY